MSTLDDRRDEGTPRALHRRLLAGAGRFLVVASSLLALFVAYLLWGTGVHEARAQRELRRELAPVLQAARAPVPVVTSTAPVPGDAIALLEIPRLGLSKAVVEGVTAEALRRAPGHYPGTALPGQLGNAGIAGHRTTYGAPFGRLDELRAGDSISVTTRQGRFRYRVTGSQVVAPGEVWVLDDTGEATLTLTTCTPRYSAAQRLVVTASLEQEPAPSSVTAPSRQVEVAVRSDADPGNDGARRSAVLWGGLVAAVAVVIRAVGRRYTRKLHLLVGASVIAVPLLVFYDRVAQLLPTNI